MVILCNRNQELRHTGYLQQLIIFPLIIARCAEATLRVLLFRLGVTQGALPLDPARGIMPLDPVLFTILRRRLRPNPQPSAHSYNIKHGSARV